MFFSAVKSRYVFGCHPHCAFPNVSCYPLNNFCKRVEANTILNAIVILRWDGWVWSIIMQILSWPCISHANISLYNTIDNVLCLFFKNHILKRANVFLFVYFVYMHSTTCFSLFKLSGKFEYMAMHWLTFTPKNHVISFASALCKDVDIYNKPRDLWSLITYKDPVEEKGLFF